MDPSEKTPNWKWSNFWAQFSNKTGGGTGLGLNCWKLLTEMRENLKQYILNQGAFLKVGLKLQ